MEFKGPVKRHGRTFVSNQFPQVIDLNVGGRHLTTSLATLTKYPDSMLAAMFSGRHHVTQDKDGRYFIDVDGDVFIHILNFLRLQILPPKSKMVEVKKYAEYFGIEELGIACSDDTGLISQEAFFSQWASKIPNYSRYLHHLTNGLKKTEIQDGYIYVILSKESCDSPHCRHLDSRGNICYSCTKQNHYNYVEVRIDNISDEKRITLFTVLAHDLMKMGFNLCPETSDTRCCCKIAKLFKVNFCRDID